MTDAFVNPGLIIGFEMMGNPGPVRWVTEVEVAVPRSLLATSRMK